MNSFKLSKSVFVLLIIYSQTATGQNIDVAATTTVPESLQYSGSYSSGNYVWGGAMNLAWNELTTNLIKDKIKTVTTDPVALSLVNQFNNSSFTKKDLDLKSYYIKSGFGQKTADEINKETSKRFPSQSFSGLAGNFGDRDMIAYAYFSKMVFYPIPFTETETTFEGEQVMGFYAWKHKERNNVRIIKYNSDERFIVCLKLKEDSDQLILAKGYKMTDPEMVINTINQNLEKEPDYLESVDNFVAPKLNLDHHRDYIELINKQLANDGYENFRIGQMFENIIFTLDEKGAKAENVGIIIPEPVSFDPGVHPRHFELNKPFWVVMKRMGSKDPYFILGVNNSLFMEKVKK